VGEGIFLSSTNMRLFVAIVLLTASFVCGWQLRGINAQRDVLQIQAGYAEQLAAAQQQARQREQVLQQKMQDIQYDTQQKLAEIRSLERAAADSRVRELTTRYADGSNRSHSPVTDRCPAERARAGMLAELLTDLDELAAVFAFEADQRRIAGLACEKAYAQIRKGH